MAKASKELLGKRRQLIKTSSVSFQFTAASWGQKLASQQFESKHTSELTVVQTLLEAMHLEGVVFTLDALHAQKNSKTDCWRW